ncbi:diguanylate cyclase [Simiduia curdlanivorans]|uniref:diguanylate cyclase n=1 Tax=Simiduia curdlanivorans TaxID=1492769 RepID=A0ABV8V0G5_9GAMM|nr:diguanylate cyclase [Simiduia curdlanivorans]MDN3639142.1 diguanylate cyclase [Simiduia curdlanivorans]
MVQIASHSGISLAKFKLILCLLCIFPTAVLADIQEDIRNAKHFLLSSPAQTIALLSPYTLDSADEVSASEQLELLALLARAYIVQSELQLASQIIDQLETLALEQKDLLYQGIVLRERGAILFIQTQYGSSLELYNLALEKFQLINDALQVGLTYNAMAQSLRAQLQYSQALSFARKSLALLRESGATAAMADVLNAMGVIFERLNNLEESLVAHSQAMDIRRALNDRPGLADSLYNIGEIHRELKDYASAEMYLSESVAVDRDLNNVSNLAYGLFKLADIQCAQNKYDVAKANGLQALALFSRLNAIENVVAANANLVKLELRMGTYTEAAVFLSNAEALLTNDMSAELKFRLGIYRAKLFVAEGEFAKAELILRNHIAVQLDGVNVELQLMVYRMLSDLLAQQGKTKEALAVLNAHNTRHDKIMSESRLQSIANVQSSVDFMRREQQLALLSRDKDIADVKESKRNFERNTVVFGFVVLFFLLFTLFGRYQSRRINFQLKQQVAERTAELEAKNAELQRAYGQLQAISQTDLLTGLSNRRFLQEHIEHDCAKSIRDYLNWLQGKAPVPNQSDLLFFLIDLDGFKNVNDLNGHAAGDLVLAQMKNILAQIFRETDYQVRWGGEEFLVVARFSQRENAAMLAERIRALIAETEFDIKQAKPLSITASIGFSCFPFFTDRPAQYNWQQVVDIADTCLYAAKQSGRNCWVGLTGVEGLEKVDTFDRLFTEPEQVIYEGWVNLYTSLEDPRSLSWQVRSTS